MNPYYQPHAGPSTHPTPSSSSSNSPTPANTAPAALGPLVEPHQDLNEFLETFWTRQMEHVERENPDFKTYPLPLARIKKVMKSDEEVKMISAEAPIMFSRACEIFISELTCRAWLVAESHKRRTLQKSDVAAAIGLSDMFDFLIDILPRDDGDAGGGGSGGGDGAGAGEGEGEEENGEEGAGEEGEDAEDGEDKAGVLGLEQGQGQGQGAGGNANGQLQQSGILPTYTG